MDVHAVTEATGWQLVGAGCFGSVIGWLVYAIQRHRRGAPTLRDLVTLLGVIGGTAVLALFPARSELFAAYGIGLAVGFFLYFLMLLLFVAMSGNFGVDWFLDGRRKRPQDGWYVPTRAQQARHALPPMADPGHGADPASQANRKA